MAKTIDILEIERARAANGDYATIHLFVEGTFYRAYEWSAWLCCRMICDSIIQRTESLLWPYNRP